MLPCSNSEYKFTKAFLLSQASSSAALSQLLLSSQSRHTVNMDPDVHKLIILLVFQLSLLTTLECLSRDDRLTFVWHWHQLRCMTLALHGFKRLHGRRQRRVWAHQRGLHQDGFFDQNLLGSFNAREFKGRMRMDVSTFEYLCSTLAPDLQRQDTSMRLAIPVQVKVAVAISRLATGNSMQCIADLYRIGLSTSQLAVSQFCVAIKKNLLKKFIEWPSPAIMKRFAQEFEDLHQIPYVVGAVDGSHIPIITPRLHAADYYNRRGFHSIMLQGVVSSKCLFWDFDIGRTGSMHDTNLWARSELGQYCEAGKLSPYALVGDATYPCRPWMLAPFKSHKDGLTQEQYHWNYLQSSTRMCIERAFGMLKCRWRILLKRVDVHLKNVPDLISTCLVLHNMCIIFGDSFWKNEWMREAIDEVHSGLAIEKVPGSSMQERLPIANLALHSLAGIDDNSRETLEYFKQEAAMEFEIAMDTGGKTVEELSARRNGVTKSLWMAKMKASIAQTFTMDSD